MGKVINIYDAKTNLSKYIKQAKAGRPVYIGSYGQKEVVLMAAETARPKIKFGTAAGKLDDIEKVLDSYDAEVKQLFYGPDSDS